MKQYLEMKDDEDQGAVTAIMKSLEKRWAVADQEVFIAAVVLNPFYRTVPFAQVNQLNNAGIQVLLASLYYRFYNNDAPEEFYTELDEYLNCRGRYLNMNAHCGRMANFAANQVCDLVFVS